MYEVFFDHHPFDFDAFTDDQVEYEICNCTLKLGYGDDASKDDILPLYKTVSPGGEDSFTLDPKIILIPWLLRQ